MIDPLKLIVSSRGRIELYDLRADAGELRNLADVAAWADERAALERVLDRRAPPRDHSRP
jgi:hypothetical protein